MELLSWLKKSKAKEFKKELSEIDIEIKAVQQKAGELISQISQFLNNPSEKTISAIDMPRIKKMLQEQLALENAEESHLGRAGKVLSKLMKSKTSTILAELNEGFNELKSIIYQQMWFFDLGTKEQLKPENIATLKRTFADQARLLKLKDRLAKALAAEAELEDKAKDKPYLRGCRKIVLPTGKELIFKPERIQEPYHVIKNGMPTGDIIPQHAQVLNEVAASIIDEELGFNIVPKTRTRTAGGDFGAVRELIEPATTADHWLRENEVTDALMEEITLKRALDYLINNQDVHLGNWLIMTDKDKVVAIDNALAFVEGDDENLLSAVRYSKNLLKKLLAANDHRIKMRLLELGIQSEFVDGFFARKNKLVEHLMHLKSQPSA